MAPWCSTTSNSARRATLVFLALMAAVPASADTTPADHHSARRGRWLLALGLDARYDSNILEYSAVERSHLGDPAYADKFRIRHAGDTVLRPSVELAWEKNLLRQRATRLSWSVDPTHYVDNPYLDRQSYGFDVSQELGRDRRATMNRIGLSLSTTPRTTMRKLKDDDVSLAVGHTVRVDARYSSREARLEGTVELVKKRFALDLGADVEKRDYIPTLRERSGTITGWDARFVGFPSRKGRLRLRAGWRAERYDGRGDNPATPLAEDDISSDRHAWSADLRWSWGKGERGQRVFGSVEREKRDYTAPSPFDFYHHSRHDDRFAWSCGWRRSLPHDLALSVALAGDGSRSRFSEPPPPTVTPEDATDYDATTVTVGLDWRVNLGGKRKRSRG